jgi:hypothetical protein
VSPILGENTAAKENLKTEATGQSEQFRDIHHSFSGEIP